MHAAVATPIPRLHAIAADEILDRPDFIAAAQTLLEWGGPLLALHLRAHGRAGGALFDLAGQLLPVAARAGALVVVNDRLDIALALGLGAVQLGRRSLPLSEARRIAPASIRLGYSAHEAGEAVAAAAAGAAWLLLGTIYETPSHPDCPGAGPSLVAAVYAALGQAEQGRRAEAVDQAEQLRPAEQPRPAERLASAPPIIAIGGMTPERVPEVMAAGAHGVAVLRGIWAAADPVAAAEPFRVALERAAPASPASFA